MKTFAIVGAGAVGSYYGGRLAEAGHEVRFLLRADFDEVSRKGLRVKSVDGDFELTDVLCARTSMELGPVDVVIVAWKATSNVHYNEVLQPLLHERSIIVTLQNGLGNVEELSRLFGAERLLGALCFVCINRLAPGLISHTGGGMIAIGGEAPGLEDLAEVFRAAKISTKVVSNLGEAQWRKLVWNVPFNGLCITEGGIDTEELLSKPSHEDRVRVLMAEVITGAAALGFSIEPEFIDEQVERTRPMGKYRPSSMIDYVEGRPVELDAIWSEPLRRAKAAGVYLPEFTALEREISQALAARADR